MLLFGYPELELNERISICFRNDAMFDRVQESHEAKLSKHGHSHFGVSLFEHFLELESLRLAHGQIPVLHDAVRLGGVADTGTIGPFFANVTDEAALKSITAAALKLRAANAKAI